MNERQADELLEEYDNLADDAATSNHYVYEANLCRLFHFLDTTPPLSTIVRRLEGGVEFDSWYEDGKSRCTGRAGSGTLEWPPDSDRRLGLQLALFRAFQDGKTDVSEFCTHFMYTSNRFDDMVAEVNDQLFRPMVRDLRKQLSRQLEFAVAAGDDVPASDRYVRLNHNAPEYRQATEALAAVTTAVSENNEYAASAPEDREQRLAELDAGRRLLQAVRVSPKALWAVLAPALGYLALKFTDATIGGLADAALAALRSLLGL